MTALLHRPVVLELSSGERIRGVLVHATPELYCVRLEESSIVVEEREVVRLEVDEQAAAAQEPERLAEAGPEEADPAAAELAPPEPPVRLERIELGAGPARVAGVREVIFAGPEELRTYLLLDGASLPAQVLAYLEAKQAGHLCLYPGRLSREQRAVAPYLVRLEAGEKLDQRLVPTGWGQHWGVFLRSRAEPAALVEHLRAFLVVADPRGERHHLRFFDPRVLETLLERADEHEAATLFGGAWTRRRDGREDMVCPLCDADFPALSAECRRCQARFWARSESVPFLIAEVVLEADEGAALVRARPAPDSFEGGRRPPMRRGPQRGRKVLNLRAEQWEALREAHRWRRLERWLRSALQQAAAERWQALGPIEARAAIKAALRAARARGLEAPVDAARLVAALFWQPGLAERASDPLAPPSEQAEALWREVAARATRAGFDPDAAPA